ncbi:MAG: hypothetical protein E6J91_31495 [Deltaproteobacteria bacterium]|nr:MAG: hypothetical protein E6J91_31495 [Deltaproteobacteria bacterium]
MAAFVCSCPRNQLCPSCDNQALRWFGGKACSRGIAWAESVARRRPRLLQQPWPHEGRTAELARSKVRDLSGDPQVIELLAQGVSDHAMRRWRQLQCTDADRRARAAVAAVVTAS